MAMTITIDQAEITTALAKHVRDLMPHLPEDIVISADLSATRGPSGYTAEIRLLSAEQAAEEEKAERAAERAAKKSSETAPEKPKQVRVKASGNKPLGIAQAARQAKQETVEPVNSDQVKEPEPVAEEAPVAETETPPFETGTEEVSTEEETARAADAMDLNAVQEASDEAEEQLEDKPVEDEAEAQPEAKTETVKVEQVGGSDEPVAPRRSLFNGLTKPEN